MNLGVMLFLLFLLTIKPLRIGFNRSNQTLDFSNTFILFIFDRSAIFNIQTTSITFMNNKNLSLSFMLVASLFTTSVLATSDSQYKYPQPFIGIQGGYQFAQDDEYDHNAPSSAIYGIYGGLQFSPSWSWDLGYQYHDELEANATSVNVKTWLIESAVRYDWYLTDNVSLYGRIGAAYWDMEKDIAAAETTMDATGFSPLGELGVNYNITPSLHLSAGYQYIDSIGQSDTGKYDDHSILLGLSYTFIQSAEKSSSEAREEPHELTVITPKVHTYPQKTISGILFKTNSTDITQDTTQQLSNLTVSEILQTHPQAHVEIIGYTDSTGPKSYNQRLSEQRAQSVANRLIKQGVNPSQIDVSGNGESKPVASNDSLEGRSQNRRVEIIILPFEYQP